MTESTLKYRGYLIHLSHYDPRWCERKAEEKPFSLKVALEVVGALAEFDFNTLIIDCADGVTYASHPELKRHYSVPMSDLRSLADAARKLGLEIVPKLNFAKSPRHQHDAWMRPHSVGTGYTAKDESYWKVAGELIDELVEVCQPESFFQIGLDEDDERTLEQYVESIHVLKGLLGRHNLHAMMWSDACSVNYPGEPEIRGKRAHDAEKLLDHDIVQMIWSYRKVFPELVKRIAGEGFDLWVAPGTSPEHIREWKKALIDAGGVGLLMTQWVNCDEDNRDSLLERIRTVGPAYA